LAGNTDGPTSPPRKAELLLIKTVFSFVGLVGSAYQIIHFPPESTLRGLQIATSNTVTMATVGAVFGLTTCLSAHIREDPEDALNYLIGGCASGIALGARTHKVGTGASACVVLGLTAALTKIGKREGWKLSGPPEY
uniref:NADH dehydrogenase [ubiquinone] 1 alpha subcomplex subunit 11 n=1 Tax=Pelodiscus sinensis TaxID=13735 RepID=K7F269_PELSI